MLQSLKHEDDQQSVIVELLIEFLEKVALIIAKNSGEVWHLDWRQLEELMQYVFRELGYLAHLTPHAGDGGRDLIVGEIKSSRTALYNVEIKHWKSAKPGISVFNHLLEVSLKEKRAGALLISTSGVSDNALSVRTELYENYVRVGNENYISTTCRHFVRKRMGLWKQPKPLNSVIFQRTY